MKPEHPTKPIFLTPTLLVRERLGGLYPLNDKYLTINIYCILFMLLGKGLNGIRRFYGQMEEQSSLPFEAALSNKRLVNST